MDYQRLQTFGSAPSSPTKGQIYVDDSLGLGWYDGSEWVYASTGGGGGTVDSVVAGTGISVDDTDPANPVVALGFSEIDGHLTLGGEPVSAVPPTSGGPYALVWNGTDWVPETFMAHASGTPAGGDKLMTDSSGNPYWVDDTNDALQYGFVGITNPGIVSAAISASPALSFTNWPTSDLVWLSSGSRPQRFVCPAPGTLNLTGVTSGDWAYVYAQLVSPGNPGGSPTVILHVGTSRSTAALAAADQVANTGGTIVWDGVVKNTGGTYTLTGGTPASGSVIPSAGRDRRLWARGGHSKIKYTAGSITLGASVALLSSSGLSIRMECSGLPVRLRLLGVTQSGTGGASQNSVGFRMDGTTIEGVNDGVTQGYIIQTASTFVPLDVLYEFTPSAGSHLFQPTGAGSGPGSPIVYAASAAPLLFIVEEVLRQDANNGTA